MNRMKVIKPLGDRVLILPQPKEEKTVNGIIIPDSCKETQSHGEVIAIGNSVKDLHEGDTVLYNKHIGTEYESDGTKYMIIHESDILAIVK